MTKRSRKKNGGSPQENDVPLKQGIGKLLEEIIQESLKPECNLILLDGKIRGLEKSGENYLPFLMKKLRQGKSPEQKVILDLMMRKKTGETIKILEKIIQENVVSIKNLLQVLLQLQKWQEAVDENLLKLLEEGEKIIYSIEKFSQLGGFLEEETERSILQKFAFLPKNLKSSIAQQVADEYPKAFPLIAQMIMEEKELDEEMINLLATHATVEVGEVFGKLLKETKDKNLRRLLKRHLFQMKSKGLDVSIPDREESEPLKFVVAEPSQAQVYVTGIDYVGDRLIFLSKSVVGLGGVFFQITVSDHEGIKNFTAFDLKRSEIKNLIKKISTDGVLQLTDIKPDYAYFLIDEAYQINLKKGITLPEQFSYWKTEIDDLRGALTEPPIYACLPQDVLHEETLKTSRDSYHSLLETEALKGWFLEPRLIWSYVEKFKEVETSPLVLDPHHVDQRRESIFTEAAQKIFNDDFRKIYRRRLEETAYIFLRTNKEDAAKLALCAAYDLGSQGIVSEKHGFLHTLIRRSILFYAEENERRKDRSLIVPR